MTTGERMKKRRKEIGLSAEKVAELLGVSPSTVYRYENGDIENMPGSILEPISNILMTTPAYLMGWDYSDLSISEMDLINNYRQATDAGRAAISAFAEATMRGKY